MQNSKKIRLDLWTEFIFTFYLIVKDAISTTLYRRLLDDAVVGNITFCEFLQLSIFNCLSPLTSSKTALFTLTITCLTFVERMHMTRQTAV